MKKDEIKIIKSNKVFQNINEHELEIILNNAFDKARSFKGSTVLWDKGEKLDYFYIVMQGEFISYRIFTDGKLNLINKFCTKDVLGLDIVLTEKKTSPYSLECQKDGVLIPINTNYLLTSDHILDSTRIELLKNMTNLLANDNIKKQYKIDILSKNSLRHRILTYLNIQKSNNRSNSFDIPFNREELADFLCVNRSALSHELSLLKKEGLIYFYKNHIRVFF